MLYKFHQKYTFFMVLENIHRLWKIFQKSKIRNALHYSKTSITGLANEMSEGGRKRSSKWDLIDEPEFAPGSKQMRSGRSSADVAGSNSSKWSYSEGNDELKPDYRVSDATMDLDTDRSYSKNMSPLLEERKQKRRSQSPKIGWGSSLRDSNKDDIMNKDYGVWDATMDLDTDRSYSKNMSPLFEERRQNRRSQSPKSGWGRSVRRSRSRSPPHGFRRDSGINDRIRTRVGGSSQPCRDFASGTCRRGSLCNFLHHDNQNPENSWESKHREDGAPRYSDTHESRDHSFRSGRANEACINFAKGRCRQGSSCKFVHHNNSDGYGKVSGDELTREKEIDRRRRDSSFEQGGRHGYGKVSVDELTREKEIDKRRGDSSFEQGGRHGPNRSSDIPCKFFANGNCRNGKYCRFSHDRQACRSPDRRSRDDRWASNPSGDHQMFDRPKMSDTASPNRRLRDDRWGSDGNTADADKVRDSLKRNDAVATSDRAKLIEHKTGNVGVTDPKFTDWPTGDAWGHSLDKSRVLGEPPFLDDKKEADHWVAENTGANMHSSQSIGADIWSDEGKMSPDWNYRLGPSSHIEEYGQNRHGITQGGTYLATSEHDRVQVAPGHGLYQNAQSVDGLSQVISRSPPTQDKHGIMQGGACVATSEHDRVQVTPGQGFNQNVHSVNSLHSSSGHAVGQSQVTVPILPSRGVDGTHNREVSTEIMDASLSQVISRNPPTQNKHGITQGGAYLATSEYDRVEVAPGQGFNQNAQSVNPLHSSSGHADGQSQVAVPILPSIGVVGGTHNQEISTEKNCTVESSTMNASLSQVISRNPPTLNKNGITQGGTYFATSEHDRVQVAPGQGFNQNSLHSSSGYTIGQSQVAVPILPSRGGILDGTHNHEVSTEKKYLAEPSIMDGGLSQVISTPTQNMVSKEQIAQLTNLSASLAHILGTGQQLPQLYAALNSHDLKDTPSLAKTEVPSMPVSNTSINPDPAVGLPQLYDPTSDSIEPNADAKKVSAAIPATKRIAEPAAEIPSQLPDSGRQSRGDSIKPASSELVKSDKIIQLQPGKNFDVNKDKSGVLAAERRRNSRDAHKNTKEDGPLDNMDQPGGPDEAKKTKDVKELRAFKFSLADLVKELLKPAWKEGQVNKEDFKTIVKKVVEKVSGTMQGSQIPQTKEKIDQYLSVSRTKLTKLVQAYVEKVQKA
ncbi:zinc finger CCCH domain-containing protein 55-like isoform X2 [Lotus japonicus]|uniref:zinc finger CCCH domain-containing protein 55-like isoform X2 n=1 Tax=Lotus japonicus TaxID=34305 RepID=UPI002587C9E3|nr:zinc finger CCCH domain-containing protein 55-like isoform X2 [Lotus japonicus]